MAFRIRGITHGLTEKISHLPFHKQVPKEKFKEFSRLDLKDKLKQVAFIHVSRPFLRVVNTRAILDLEL